MSNIEKTAGGFRAAIQDLLIPEFKALQVKVEAVEKRLERIESRIVERIDKIDERLDKHDEKFDKLITEMHTGFLKFEEKLANVVSEMHDGFRKNDEKFVQLISRLAEIEGSIKIIVNRLDYKERVDEMDFRLRKIEERFEKIEN